jgi:hypothetical protein
MKRIVRAQARRWLSRARRKPGQKTPQKKQKRHQPPPGNVAIKNNPDLLFSITYGGS